MIIKDRKYILHDDNFIIIPPGKIHNITNISDNQMLKLYTIYSPPEHDIGCIQINKSNNCTSKKKSAFKSKIK